MLHNKRLKLDRNKSGFRRLIGRWCVKLGLIHLTGCKSLPKGIDVLCKLQHFFIITYAVDPSRFTGLFPDRFTLDIVEIDGAEKALISVVPFIDVDFTSAVYPFPKFTMGQTNYRIYIIDKETRERCVWFLGTTLDSWTLAVPKLLWNLPWYTGDVNFDCDFDESLHIGQRFRLQAQMKARR